MGLFSHRRHTEPNDSPQEDAKKGAPAAQAACNKPGDNNNVSPPSRGTFLQRKPSVRRSDRKSRQGRGSSSHPEGSRQNEIDRKPVPPPKTSPMIAPLQNQVNKEPVEIGPSRETATCESNLTLPQVTDLGEFSGPWEDRGKGGMESGHEEHSSDSNLTIFNHLRRVTKEFPSAHFQKVDRSSSGIEKAVQDLIRAFESAYSNADRLEKALKSMEKQCESLRTDHSDKLAKNNKEFEDKMSNQRATLEREHGERMTSGMKALVESHGREKEYLKNETEKQHRDNVAMIERAAKEDMARMKTDLEHQIFRAQDSLSFSTQQYEKWLETVQRQHREEIRQMSNGFNTEKSRMRNEFHEEKSTVEAQKSALESLLTTRNIESENNKKRMTAGHQAAIDELKERFDGEKTSMKKELQRRNDQSLIQLRKQQDQYDQELRKKDQEIEDVKKKQEAEKKRMEEEHVAEMMRQKKDMEEKQRSLVDEVEVLKGAMVERDHFKVISDRDLARRFQDLASEIDELSRERWDNRREATWPFPDNMLRKSDNERRSKQYVIQNTIWVILYERIFCTPFRVLGAEGKLLEESWVLKFGQDWKSPAAVVPCPKPTKVSERWRYETIKDCFEAICQPLLDWEPDYNIKQCYEQSLNDTTEDISHEFGRVASIDKQRMSDLVRNAAKLWLEIGQQRYRIFLVMSKSGSKPSRSGQAFVDADGMQELVASPELRRIGNAQGEKLEKEDLVPDCRGKFSVLYAG